mgnify:CR=1 FL=1
MRVRREHHAAAPQRAEDAAVDEETPLMDAGIDSLAATELASRLRKLTGLAEPKPTPQLLILDIPDQGGYYVSEDKVDAEGIAAFVAKFKAGGLERKQLG